MEVKDFLIKLCESAHVSGYGSEGTEIIRAAFSEYLPDVTTDGFGNVIGFKKGKGKGKLMFAAHMDEIGLMVSDIDERGYVGFTTIGGFDSRVFPAMEVTIHGKEKIFGVIGIKPPHILPPEDAKKVFKAEELLIDTGYGREKLVSVIRVGDIITIRSKAAELKNGCLSIKSMDDSAGVAALLSAIKNLRRVDCDYDVYFVATEQEEVGLRGAETSAYSIEPDIAVAIDVGFAKTPDVNSSRVIDMGKGPAVGVGPHIHPAVFARLKRAAKDANLRYQVEALPSHTGTDADSMQLSGTGVATGVISIPLKYMHTPVETVKLDDIEQTGRLLAEFVRGFDGTEPEEALCL